MIVKEPEAKFLPAPAGVHSAVCVDEIDMGMVTNHFQPDAAPVPTVRLVWQIGEDMQDGKPFLIKKDYRASLHEKAALRKDLEAWRGKPFTPVDLLGFDLENVVGAPATLNIIHKQGSKGGTFSNIAGIMPLAKGMVVLKPRDYMRVKDRPVKEAAPAHAPEQQEVLKPVDRTQIEDDDVPF